MEHCKSTQQARALNPTPRFTDSVDTNTPQHPNTHHPSPNTTSLNHPRLYRQLQRCLCINLCSRGTSNQALQDKGGVQDPQSRKVSPCGALQRWTDSKYQDHSFPHSNSCLKIIPLLGALSPAGSQTYMSNRQHCGLQRTVLMGAHLPESPCIIHTFQNHTCPIWGLSAWTCTSAVGRLLIARGGAPQPQRGLPQPEAFSSCPGQGCQDTGEPCVVSGGVPGTVLL